MKHLLFTASAAITLALAVQPLSAQVRTTQFPLYANPAFVHCLSNPASSDAPIAVARLIRGELNDTLQLNVHNLKPNLAFDLFTVQNSQLLFNGQVNPNFKNFGMAWYQTDVKADENGDAEVQIHTILLDQIFGFDPVVNLPPTNTFHVGFWFNNPADAAACGFDVTKPTPFNGEHRAGPLAMISVPDAHTNLGPLCTQPNGHSCNP
jgi:hypothetical protein